MSDGKTKEELHHLIDVANDEAKAVYTKHDTIWVEVSHPDAQSQLIQADSDAIDDQPDIPTLIQQLNEGKPNIPSKIWAIDNNLNKYPIAISKRVH